MACILCLVEFFCKIAQFISIDPAIVKGDFVRRTHKLSLPVLQHAHELCRFKEQIVRTSVEPSKTAAKVVRSLSVVFADKGC